MDFDIPTSCSAQQLFQDAEEVLTLRTDLAALESQFRQYYLNFYGDVPSGMTGDHIGLYIEGKIQETYPDFWVEIDTKRARLSGLLAKARIVEAATHVLVAQYEVSALATH